MSDGMPLTTAQVDRAVGAVVGSAAGDALGAHYEFATPPAPGQAAMLGGGLGNFAPGEWTDDTSQAVPILAALAAGHDLRTAAGRYAVARGWLRWWDTDAADVGVHTAAVLRMLGDQGSTADVPNPADTLAAAAADRHARTGSTAGNGALMRTGPVALGYLHHRQACAEAAAGLAALTHVDPLAGEACVLWCEAIRVAVLTGGYDGLHGALDLLAADRRPFWADVFGRAEHGTPGSFGNNSFVVWCLADAWAAIRAADHHQGPQAFAAVLDAAVRAGNDTDTVAAVAGALAGARWGATAVPAQWRQLLHGWPGRDTRDLTTAAVRAVRGGTDDAQGWPGGRSMLDHYSSVLGVRHLAVAHPDDSGVLLGTSATLRALRPGGDLAGRVDDVVALCRLGTDDVPEPVARHDIWLIDSSDPAENPNLAFVVADAVALIRELRAQNRRVLLLCAAAHSRTPTIAAAYGAAVTGSSGTDALARVRTVLPWAAPKAPFQALLARI